MPSFTRITSSVLIGLAALAPLAQEASAQQATRSITRLARADSRGRHANPFVWACGRSRRGHRLHASIRCSTLGKAPALCVHAIQAMG